MKDPEHASLRIVEKQTKMTVANTNKVHIYATEMYLEANPAFVGKRCMLTRTFTKDELTHLFQNGDGKIGKVPKLPARPTDCFRFRST